MTIPEILTHNLANKKIRSDVEAYNSIVCQTHYPKDQLVLILDVLPSSDGGEPELVIRGRIIEGENEGESCNIFVDFESTLNIID